MTVSHGLKWVVMKIGTEYNDEYTSVNEWEDGRPLLIFDDEALARKHAAHLNEQAILKTIADKTLGYLVNEQTKGDFVDMLDVIFPHLEGSWDRMMAYELGNDDVWKTITEENYRENPEMFANIDILNLHYVVKVPVAPITK